MLSITREGGYGRRGLLWLPVAAMVAFAIMLAAPNVNAAHATTTVSCAAAHAVSPGGGHVDVSVIWQQLAPTPITNGKCDVSNAAVTDSNYAGFDLAAGSTVTYECIQLSGGTLPPQAPTAIVISGYSDNANQGGGGTPIWSTSFGSCGSTANATTFTEKLTTTGAGNTAKAGIVRLFVEVINTNTGQTYDCNSDDTGTQTAPTGGSCNGATTTAETGVGRSDPGFSAPNLTASGICPCAIYQGGDTLVGSLTANASEYSASARLTQAAQDGVGPFNTLGTSYAITNGAQTESVALQGAFSTWPASGAITLRFTEAGASAITGFTGLSYWIFTANTITGGLSLTDSNHLTWASGDTVSRVGSQTGTCVSTVNGAATTVIQRGETVHVQGCSPWLDPRGQNVANNVHAEAWIQRASTFESYTDFTGFNGTFGASGDFPNDNLAQDAGAGCTGTNPGSNSCATVTTGLSYHKMVETCAAACTANEGNLWNVANSTGLIDISNQYVDTVFACKVTPCTSTLNISTSAFIIGSDPEYAIASHVHDGANNGIASLNITCQETEPDLVTTLSPVTLGATDSTGTSPTTLLEAVVEGPTGTWTLLCTGAMNGNGFSYQLTYFHASPVTAATSIVLDYNWLPNNTVGFQVGFRTVGNNGTSIVSEFPDNSSDVRICLHYAETVGHVYHGCSPVHMAQNGALAVWTANLTAPDPGNLCFIHAHAWANLTGILFLASQNLQFRPPGAFNATMNNDGTCTFAANGTASTNGNFTGTFTGVVNDTSALPASVVFPALLAFLILAGMFVSFVSKNPFASMTAFALSIVEIIIILANQSLLTNDEFTVFMVVIAGGGIVSLVRMLLLMGNRGANEV